MLEWNYLYEKEMDTCFGAQCLIQCCLETTQTIWIPKYLLPKNNFCLSSFQISSLKHVLGCYDTSCATNVPTCTLSQTQLIAMYSF